MNRGTRTGRWLRVVALTLGALVLVVLAAWQFALHALKGRVEQALGPRGEVAQVEVGLHAVVVHGLRVRADRPGGAGWPAEDELRARRIVIVPRWTDLLSARPRVESVRVEDAYVSLLRTRDGRLRVLPALLDGPAGPPGASSALVIDNVELRSSTLDLYDATVARTPYRISLQALTADIGPVVLPALDTRVDIDLSGIVKGPRGDGRLALKGWLVPASKDAELAVSLRDVDLRALQPYLVRAAETDVKQGRMDLDLQPVIRAQHLKAPGVLTLHQLELASGSRFMGLPREALVSLMKDANERIRIAFTLEGRIDDPAFSLNENLATRLASGLAESLGVSFSGLVRGVGRAGSAVVEGVGDAFNGLFGGDGK
ncbi:DUF748 domain-containing protein [Methyloversatilis thermotolerans]|uniref:DUF748 domain-containing protein n=1 Tax=Methyloversatilis thermotolerans TaxID=1346290 RepID=UPI00036A4897|nr:DUF748 domain-containing protein [Methyloversatilis thermotolerans]